ncbi:MAG: hypothetical protein ACK53Y_05900, partial [bacterium]
AAPVRPGRRTAAAGPGGGDPDDRGPPARSAIPRRQARRRSQQPCPHGVFSQARKPVPRLPRPCSIPQALCCYRRQPSAHARAKPGQSRAARSVSP